MKAARTDDRLRDLSSRSSESQFVPGQRVTLVGWDGLVIEEVTISEIMEKCDQCKVVRRSGAKELVSERRLRA